MAINYKTPTLKPVPYPDNPLARYSREYLAKYERLELSQEAIEELHKILQEEYAAKTKAAAEKASKFGRYYGAEANPWEITYDDALVQREYDEMRASVSTWKSSPFSAPAVPITVEPTGRKFSDYTYRKPTYRKPTYNDDWGYFEDDWSYGAPFLKEPDKPASESTPPKKVEEDNMSPALRQEVESLKQIASFHDHPECEDMGEQLVAVYLHDPAEARDGRRYIPSYGYNVYNNPDHCPRGYRIYRGYVKSKYLESAPDSNRVVARVSMDEPLTYVERFM